MKRVPSSAAAKQGRWRAHIIMESKVTQFSRRMARKQSSKVPHIPLMSTRRRVCEGAVSREMVQAFPGMIKYIKKLFKC